MNKKNKPSPEADEISMSYEQVRDLIGKENMTNFIRFMNGQTVCVRSNGKIGYYHCDVDKFRQLARENRNLHVWEWD
jgi:hypothetical protein